MDNNWFLGLNTNQEKLMLILEPNLILTVKVDLVEIMNKNCLDLLIKFIFKLQDNFIINKGLNYIKL